MGAIDSEVDMVAKHNTQRSSYSSWFCHFSLTFFLLLSLFSIAACGGSGSVANSHSENKPLGTLPQAMKALDAGSMHGVLKVYGPQGQGTTQLTSLVISKELTLDATTGEFFSEQFEITTGLPYLFVVEFNFKASGLPELPIAFAALAENISDEVHSIFFSTDMFFYDTLALPEALSFSLNAGLFPDLNPDGDSVSTFAEIREGMQPLVADQPFAPSLVEDTVNRVDNEDVIQVDVVLRDPSGVEAIEAVSPKCGYLDFVTTPLNAEHTEVRLQATFNTHATAVEDSIDLVIRAKDTLGAQGEIAFTGVEFFRHDPPADEALLNPIIAILTPQENETIAGSATVEALACDQDGIDSLEVEGVLASGFTLSPDATHEHLIGTLNTDSIQDGPQNLLITAVDPKNGRTTVQRTILVANQETAIIVDTPTPGSSLRGPFSFIARVNPAVIPNATSLFIESILDVNTGAEVEALSSLRDNSSLSTTNYTAHAELVPELKDLSFEITLVAVTSDNQRFKRSVLFSINNEPQVEVFEVLGGAPRVCLAGGEVELRWDVKNMDFDDEIRINGQVMERHGVSILKGRDKFACSTHFTLDATRFARDSNNHPISFSDSAQISDVGVIGLGAPDAGTLYLPDQVPVIELVAEPAQIENLKWQ